MGSRYILRRPCRRSRPVINAGGRRRRESASAGFYPVMLIVAGLLTYTQFVCDNYIFLKNSTAASVVRTADD